MKKPCLALRLAAAHVAAGVALLTSVPHAYADIPLKKAAEQPAEPTSQPRTQSAASEPTPTDAWGQAIRRGAKQEGIKTDEQKEEDEAEEAKLMAERLKLRWSVHAGVGAFATQYTLSNTRANSGYLQLGGAEFALGPGLRKGLSRLWDFQARASLSIVPASDERRLPNESSQKEDVSREARGTMVIPSVDATFRVHFGAASPWFFGTGARFGTMVVSGTLVEKRTSSTGTSFSEIPHFTVVPFVQALLEIGVVVADHIELVVRPSLGLTPASVGFIGGGAYAILAPCWRSASFPAVGTPRATSSDPGVPYASTMKLPPRRPR
ncbi:MAG: hypothetical protein IPF92_17220 [Myxococcales bacterium]|nr:hypothetical protein [Myxococcales bacterium]